MFKSGKQRWLSMLPLNRRVDGHARRRRQASKERGQERSPLWS